jgi:hypothetical protein
MIRTGFIAFALAFALHAGAQDAYPTKPIKLIVPFPPAGGTDVLSRAVAQSIATSNKWTIVVENRPGAGGNIGLEAAAKSPPDGYTVAMGQTANLAVNPALYAKMPFDPIKDFAPIALVSSQPLVLVVGGPIALQIAQGRGRRGEGEAGCAQHGLGGQRHHRPYRRRALPAARGRQVRAHSLQGRGTGRDRPHGRQRRSLLRQHAIGGGPGRGREAARDRGAFAEAASRYCPTCRR